MLHLLNALRKTTLTFVEKTPQHGDVWSLTFTANRPLKHIAGQHAAFIVPGAGFHVFSIASAPEENFVMIGTHLREGSKYKAALAALKPGDTISMYGPVLNFTLEDAPQSNVFLAQGIGITPYRSMLVHNARQATPKDITLIHSDGETPTFGGETINLAQALFPTTPAMFTDDLTAAIKERPDARFYLSGSPGFIKAAKKTLHDGGVPRTRIKTDSFWGY